jgi:hypothetical protein
MPYPETYRNRYFIIFFYIHGYWLYKPSQVLSPKPANQDGRNQSVDFMPQFGEFFHALGDIPF